MEGIVVFVVCLLVGMLIFLYRFMACVLSHCRVMLIFSFRFVFVIYAAFFVLFRSTASTASRVGSMSSHPAATLLLHWPGRVGIEEPRNPGWGSFCALLGRGGGVCMVCLGPRLVAGCGLAGVALMQPYGSP